MMRNPILQRELFGMLRTRRALAIQIVPAVIFGLVVLLCWPGDAQVDLFGARAREVFRLFSYSLLVAILLLVPAFPATSIVRERVRGTLALLLNSPLTLWSIYFGKILGALAFALLPLAMSLPAAAACYAMGGLSLENQLLPLYGVLALLTMQLTVAGLLVSSCSISTESALRITYGVVLFLTVIVLGPHQFLQGKDRGPIVAGAELLHNMSPLPAIMEIVGHGDVGGHGLTSRPGAPGRYAMLVIATVLAGAAGTIWRLGPTHLERERPPGVVTDDRNKTQRWLRRFVFLVDPQRRTRLIGRFSNPVMIKEFRCRRFGRSQWLMRLIALCAIASLGLTYASTTGTLDWGVEVIGGLMVLMQFALICLLVPSLAASLISAEQETHGWTLLMMTPLSAGQIVRGKLMSVAWTLLLILMATLPGYLVMVFIQPSLTQQITYVLFTLLMAAVSALLLSAAVSSVFTRTVEATVTAYSLLMVAWGGTMLFWLGRDGSFGHSTVESILAFNPLAASLCVMGVPGFAEYQLVPTNWWITGAMSFVCMFLLTLQTWRLTRPG